MGFSIKIHAKFILWNIECSKMRLSAVCLLKHIGKLTAGMEGKVRGGEEGRDASHLFTSVHPTCEILDKSLLVLLTESL